MFKTIRDFLYRFLVTGRRPLTLDITWQEKYVFSLWLTKQHLTRPILGANLMLDVSSDLGPSFIFELHVGVFSFLIDFSTIH